jgi:hypothetical protein
LRSCIMLLMRFRFCALAPAIRPSAYLLRQYSFKTCPKYSAVQF